MDWAGLSPRGGQLTNQMVAFWRGNLNHQQPAFRPQVQLEEGNMEDTKESNSSGKSPEGRSREPLLQLQSLQGQAQGKQVSLAKVHGLKELSWPPRVAAGGQSTSLKQFSLHPLPHSQAPVIITAGRPIVILPNDYISDSRYDFPPGASLSAAFPLHPQSLGHLHDPTPAPIITPVDDDDYVATTPGPAVTPIDDDSLNMEYTLPAGQFGGVKAIEFTDNKQCIAIVPGQPEADLHNKEESTLSAGKHASQDISCENVSKPLNPAQKIPSIIEFGATSLPKLDPMPNNDESANSTTNMPPQNPSANDPLSLEVESVNKAPNLEQLQLPVQKSSSMRVSPLIMSCYEESKEQLVLDDSDSELEMPECSKSASCTPQQNAEQTNVSKNGIDQIGDSSINTLQPKEETLDADGPPPKRVKMADTPTTDSDTPGISDYHHSPTDSSENQDDAPHKPIVEDSSTVVADPREKFGQTVPNESPLFADCEPLEATEPTKISSTLAATLPDHSLKLDCPHAPADVQVSDGKDTVDQMLPMESAREHAMVPNLARCANDNRLDDDRDEPNDNGSGSTHFKVYVPTVDQHSSHLESFKGVQAGVDDDLVPGQTVVEQGMETTIQVPELHGAMPSLYDPPTNSADIIDIQSTKPQAGACIPSMVIPSTVESAQLPAEHQIVPEEFPSNATPSSSQSLYTDHDFHDNCKRPLQLQNESSIVDEELNSPRVLAMSLDSIEKRWNIAASLSHSDDQTLPDLEFPSRLAQPPYTEGGSPARDSGGVDEQRGSSGHSFGPFGFQLGKHTTSHQNSGNSVSTARLNLGRPHLRLGLSKRQQCTPLHRPK